MPQMLRALLAIVAVALLLALGRVLGGYVEPFRAWVEGLGALGPLVFVLSYAAAVVAFVPGSALTLAGGAIFGVVRGTALVFVAAVLGSCCAFLVARYFARGAVERRLAGNAQFAAVDRAIGREGRKIAFLLRLSPVIPFTLLELRARPHPRDASPTTPSRPSACCRGRCSTSTSAAWRATPPAPPRAASPPARPP